MSQPGGPGAKLKALRLEKRLTLTELSLRTGLPISTISKVENDKMSLSYDKLQSISTGLGIEAGLLFQSPFPAAATAPSGRRSVHKAGDGKQVDTHLTTYRYLASELLNKQFIPLIAEVRARSLSAFGELLSHPGEEFTYVLEGSLELHSQAYAPLNLEAGESIYFDSGLPHAYVATSKGPCRILMICSSTEAQLFDAVDRSRPEHPAEAAQPPAKLKKVSAPVRKGNPATRGKPKS